MFAKLDNYFVGARYALPLLIIALLFALTTAVYAQDEAATSADEPTPPALETLSREELIALIERAENAAENAQAAADDASGAVDLG